MKSESSWKQQRHRCAHTRTLSQTNARTSFCNFWALPGFLSTVASALSDLYISKRLLSMAMMLPQVAIPLEYSVLMYALMYLGDLCPKTIPPFETLDTQTSIDGILFGFAGS